MNTDLLVRHIIELAMTIPAAAIAVMPVFYCRKMRTKFLLGLLTTVIIIFIGTGSIICTLFGSSSNTFLFSTFMIVFLIYNSCFDISLPKKIFCFANATMLCAFSTTYTSFLTAPLELDNHSNVFKSSSGLICLGIAITVTLVFAKTLIVKFPELLEKEIIDTIWKYLMISPIVTSVIIIWMNPVNAENVMTGRLRKICIVVLIAIPLVALFLYHLFWWLSKKISENAQLQQSYDLLKMEEKQFAITQQYLQETSELRHNFKHHLLVIQDYAEKGQTAEQLAYIKPLADIVDKPVKSICRNIPLNAICSHYSYKANEQGIHILWGIDLDGKVPISETELCAVIGNLIDNAIHAVSKLNDNDRVIDLRMGMVSPTALAISIKNTYSGTIVMDKNGLPVANKKNHGIGLRSVFNTVERYSGSMVIQTVNQVFDVSIVMYTAD